MKKRPGILLLTALTPLAILPLTSPAADEREGPGADPSAAAIREIDQSLDAASSKLQALGDLIREAQTQKLQAQAEAQQSNDDLLAVKNQLKEAASQLEEMKERESKHREHLEGLEAKLTAATEKARAESEKLEDASANLVSWEQRAHLAEDELQRTRQAASLSLEVARNAKAAGAQWRQELAQLQAVHDDQSAQLETATTSLRKVRGERNAARKSKLEAEKSLTALRMELAGARERAGLVPGLEEKITALESSLSEKTTAEVLHDREMDRLTKSAEKMKERLDEVLRNREELRDELTILKGQLAQSRANANQEHLLQDRDARLAQLERSLRAKENALQKAYQSEDTTSLKLAQAEKARQSLAQAMKGLKRELEEASKKEARP